MARIVRIAKTLKAGFNFETIQYEVGSLKEITNHNRVLDTAELLTIIYKSTDANFNDIDEAVVEGSFVSLGGFFNYVIDKVKKTRLYKDDDGVEHWQFFFTMQGAEILLQKTILPNKSLTQLVVGEPKTIGEMMQEYCDVFFHPEDFGIEDFIDVEIEYEADIEEEVAQEFTWVRPTLYDAFSDIIGQKHYLKVIPVATITGTRLIIIIVDMTEPISDFEITDADIDRIEINRDVEANPKGMSVEIENAMIGNANEVLIPQTTEYGVMQDADENMRWETVFGIGEIEEAIVIATLTERYDSIGGGFSIGHPAGEYKIDITDYILHKEVYDNMLSKPDSWALNVLPETDIKYRNLHLFFEKGQNYIGGIYTPFIKKTITTQTTFSLTLILNYISKYDDEKILEAPEKIIPFWFFNEDVKKFTLNIKYKVVDDVRYDIIKEKGFGVLPQNQSSVFINFDRYKEQQDAILNKFTGVEKVAYGRKHGGYHSVGSVYGEDEMLTQLTVIDYDGYNDWMGVISPKINRIDSDAYINTRKRFYNIIDVSDSIRRYDYFEETYDIIQFGTLYDMLDEKTYFILTTQDKSGGFLQRVLLKPLIYVSVDEMLFFAKALDNKYIGKRVITVDSTRVTEGVFYTDEDTGEFYTSKIELISLVSLPDPLYPNASHLQQVDYSVLAEIDDAIKLKDSGEKIAFTIKIKKGDV